MATEILKIKRTSNLVVSLELTSAVRTNPQHEKSDLHDIVYMGVQDFAS